MTKTEFEPAPDELSLVQRGPSYRLGELLGLGTSSAKVRITKVLLVLSVTWLPLVVLSFIGGTAISGRVEIPFFHDPEANGRFLFVLPLLEFAVGIVGVGLAAQARQFVDMGLVSEPDRPRIRAAQAATVQLRSGLIPEAILLLLAFAFPVVTRLGLGFSAGTSSWERVGSSLTPAGWWYMLVSLPFLFFFLFRWLWVFVLWAWFLFQVSRLKLEVTATHPDRCGGLGFVGWGLASFAPVLLAVSAVCSAGFADEILHHGSSLPDLKFHIAAFVIVAVVVLYAPLLLFSPQLSRCRFKGLLEIGKLVWEHDRAFDEKWIKHGAEHLDSLLGSADIQSLADAGTCYEHVNNMWLFPFDMKAFAVLLIAALLPMIPLLGTSVPLQDILLELAGMLV